MSLFTSVEVSSPGAVLSVAAMWSIVVARYFVLSWTLTGETPGLRPMHLRVVGGKGEPPRFGQSVLRLIGAILAAIPFFAGYLLILVDDRRRGLQDMIARTTVVHVAEEDLVVTAARRGNLRNLRPPAGVRGRIHPYRR